MPGGSSVQIAEAVLEADAHPFRTLSLAEGLPQITASSTTDDARRNYLSLAAVIHPDKLSTFPRSTEAFQCLVKAFECFANPKQRKKFAEEDVRHSKAKTLKEQKAVKKRIRGAEVHSSSEKGVKRLKIAPSNQKKIESESDEEEEAESSEEEFGEYLSQDNEPTVSTSRKPIGQPRVGGVYHETLIGCPQCGSRWEPDSKPQYSLFMGQWGRKAHCQLCLCRFGSATARHGCPFCNKPFYYDASMYDSVQKCSSCKKSFGFRYYPVNQFLIDQVTLGEWKEAQEKMRSAERDQRARQRLSGRSRKAIDSKEDEVDLVIGTCVMEDQCPICAKKVTTQHRAHTLKCLAAQKA